MPSFRSLLATPAPLLLIDAASTRIQVALWQGADAVRWQTSDQEAGLAIFQSIEALNVELGAVAGFVFCDGPGSILGIRTAAMALRTWGALTPRPVWTYRSIELVAAALNEPDTAVIADARRDRWHLAQLGQPLRRVPTAELPAGALATPEGFRAWSKLPAERAVRTVSYDLAALLPRVLDRDLFQPTEAPEAFLLEEPSYVTWSPQIHRAPA